MKAYTGKEVILYCDGFMKSKKERIGGAKLRFVIEDDALPIHTYYFDEIESDEFRKYILAIPQTNIVSEYFAVVKALYWAEKYLDHIDDENIMVFIHTDSEVVVSMMLGYKCCTARHLIPIYSLGNKVYDRIKERMRMQWVTRNKIVEMLGI